VDYAVRRLPHLDAGFRQRRAAVEVREQASAGRVGVSGFAYRV
jgi:hypothetical protein